MYKVSWYIKHPSTYICPKIEKKKYKKNNCLHVHVPVTLKSKGSQHLQNTMRKLVWNHFTGLSTIHFVHVSIQRIESHEMPNWNGYNDIKFINIYSKKSCRQFYFGCLYTSPFWLRFSSSLLHGIQFPH